jgi:hypothetical protein
VEVGDRWVLESPAPSGEIQHPLDASSVARRGKVKWGRGWWDVEEMGSVWVFVKGGLRVATASLKTLVCHDQDATSLQLPSDEMDRNLGSSGDGDGDAEVEEEEDETAAKRRKNAARKREWQARKPAQRCGVDGCEFQTKHKNSLCRHQALVHGIGAVDAEELRRKERERRARQPAQRCGVDGCEFQTKGKRDLKVHQARVHGIGDVDVVELRRRKREWQARQPTQRCGVDGCEFQTKDKSNLRQHQACMHGIGNVGAVEARRRKRRATKPTVSLARSNETGRAVSPYSDDNNVGL